MRGGSAVAVVAVMILVVLPLLYVLSAGPAVVLYTRGVLGTGGDRVFETVYSPLEWACQKSDLIGRPTQWYVELWQPLTIQPIVSTSLPAAAAIPVTQPSPTPPP